MVAIITTAADGTHSGTWGGTGGVTPIGGVTIEGDTIRIDVPAWRGSWEGTLSSDGSTLEGRWRQNGSTSPLVLKKTGTQ